MFRLWSLRPQTHRRILVFRRSIQPSSSGLAVVVNAVYAFASLSCLLLKRNSSVSVVTSLRAGRFKYWARFPETTRHISLLHSVRTGSEAHPASYTMDNWDYFFMGQSDRSVKLILCRVRNEWSYNSTPSCNFMAWCFIRHRDLAISPLSLSLSKILHFLLTL
jgi:hypothetical protein